MQEKATTKSTHGTSNEPTHPVAVSTAVLKAGITFTLLWGAFAVFLNAPTLVAIGIACLAGFVSALPYRVANYRHDNERRVG